VVEATGRPLADWHAQGLPPLVGPSAVRLFLAPGRAALYARIDARFETMIAAGGLDEARALAARGLDPLLPAMKAHGIPWLIRHLAGEITQRDAVRQAQLDTRHYAKRQFTWFRHQLGDWPRAAPEGALETVMRALAP
jgi:tRNA dimethylallyltransferase